MSLYAIIGYEPRHSETTRQPTESQPTKGRRKKERKKERKERKERKKVKVVLRSNVKKATSRACKE